MQSLRSGAQGKWCDASRKFRCQGNASKTEKRNLFCFCFCEGQEGVFTSHRAHTVHTRHFCDPHAITGSVSIKYCR